MRREKAQKRKAESFLTSLKQNEIFKIILDNCQLCESRFLNQKKSISKKLFHFKIIAPTKQAQKIAQSCLAIFSKEGDRFFACLQRSKTANFSVEKMSKNEPKSVQKSLFLKAPTKIIDSAKIMEPLK